MALAMTAAAVAAYSTAGGTSVAPAYPTYLAGDTLVLVLGQKPATAGGGGVTTPSGWTLSQVKVDGGGYGTTLGADTGNTSLYMFTKVATGSESGTLTVALSNNSVTWAVMLCVNSDASLPIGVSGCKGEDTTAGNVSATLSPSMSLEAGDLCIWAMCIPTDVTTPAQFSAHAISSTGATFTSVVEVTEPDSANGNDIGGFIAYSSVSAGTSTTTPTITATAGGTTTNVKGPVVLLAFKEATVNSYSITTATGSFSLAGQSAGVLFGREVLANTQSYTFTGNATNINYGRYVAAAEVSYSLAGSGISFAIGKALQLDSAAFSYTANSANLLTTRTLAADAGTFSLSGPNVNVLFSKRLVAESWTYGLSGAAASLLHGKYISGGVGAFSGSYGPSTLLVSRRLQSDAGTYSLVVSADVLKKSLLVSDSASYTMSGQSAGLVYKRIITTDSGTYTLTGQALSVLANKYLEASSGGYTSTYGPAALLVNRKLASEAANYAVTGLDVGLAYQSATALTLVAAPGSFTASYQSANVLKASKISADTGVFSFSGSSAGTLFKRILPLSAGTFSYLGQSAGTLYSRRLVSESAAYSISTPDLLLEYGRVLQLPAGIFNLSGTSVGVLAYRKLFSEQIDFSLVGSDLSFSITSALSKLFLGSISVSNLFLGDQAVLKAYLGSVQVWGGGGGAPIGFTLEVDTGAFVASYQEGAITRQMKAVGSPLAVSMSGSTVGVLIGRKVVAAAVSYTVNYNAASVVRTGAVSLGAYSVGLTSLGGGSVSFSLSSDGTTSPDTQGWFTTAPQTGVGTGKWVIFSQTGGIMSTSSPAIGSRIELTSTVTITGTYAGSAVRFANFSVQIYDAASGGNLIGSGTLYLEIDGS